MRGLLGATELAEDFTLVARARASVAGSIACRDAGLFDALERLGGEAPAGEHHRELLFEVRLLRQYRQAQARQQRAAFVLRSRALLADDLSMGPMTAVSCARVIGTPISVQPISYASLTSVSAG